MYTAHFGLTAEPFSLSPDPAFLYLSPDHEEALAALRIALQSRRGLTTLIAEVGSGKTTLLYTLLSDLGPTVHTAYLANTKLTFDELLQQALCDFGVACPSRDRLAQLDALHAFLRRCDADGAIAALVIDEAQNLDADTFEHLRLLTNFETYSAKLLQIVLVGQPELGEALRRPALRQVDERIAFRCRIGPLSRRESRRYVAHRLARAGGSLGLFTPGALALLVRAAHGVPRRINVLAHTALLFAYGRGLRRVDARIVWVAMRERTRDRSARAAAPQRRLARGAAWATAAALLAAGGVAAGAARLSLSERTAASATLPQLAAVHAPAVDHVAIAPPPLAPQPAPAAPVADDALIVVSRGMTITDVARRFYGDAGPESLRRITAANPQLRDPNRITAGDVLRVPGARPGSAKGVRG